MFVKPGIAYTAKIINGTLKLWDKSKDLITSEEEISSNKANDHKKLVINAFNKTKTSQ